MIFDATFDVRSSLEWYTVSALRTMLRFRGERQDLRTKAECLGALRERLFDPVSIRSAIASCDPLARESLELIKRRGGVMPVAALRGQLAVWHPSRKDGEFEKIPSELVRRALAFWHAPSPRGAVSSMHDVQRPAADNPLSVVVYSPPEVLAEVSQSEGTQQRPLVPVAESVLPSAAATFQRRVLSFLRAIESRSPRVLQSGSIGSRDRDALNQALEGVASDRAADRSLRQTNQPVNFLRGLLERAGLLEVSGDRTLRTTSETLRFVSLAPAQQSRLLLQAWLEVGENELLALPHLRCERRASVATVLPDDAGVRRAHNFIVELVRQQVRSGYWYAPSDLSRAARENDVEFLVSWQDPTPYRWSAYYIDAREAASPPYIGLTLEEARGRSRSLLMGQDWELVEGEFIKAVLRGPLTWLGLIEYDSGDGNERFGLTDLGAQVLDVAGYSVPCVETPPQDHSEALVVQPNFDVVVYDPDERNDLLYQIDRFAERVSIDRLAIYRITHESLSAGLQLGLAAEDILALLEGAARAPVPQNVAVTLRDWARRFDEVQFVRNAWLLEAPTSSALDRWLEDPELAAALERRISPTLALFTRNRPDNLDEKLFVRHGVELRCVNAEDPLVPVARVEGPTTLRLRESDHDLYIRAILGRFADAVPARRRYCRYQITPASVRRALQHGMTPENVLTTIESVVSGKLPSGMVLRVKGWAGAYPPVSLGTVGILFSSDPECFHDLRADPTLGRLFLGSLSPTTAIVRLDELETLRGVLREYGIGVGAYEPPTSHGPEAQAFPDGPFVLGGALVTPSASSSPRGIIEEAIARDGLVALRYRSGANRFTNHLVEPREVLATARGPVLRGYCVGSGHDRDFRLDDIVNIGTAVDQN